MNPKLLQLCEAYQPELLDPKHRHISISTLLYKDWLHQNQSGNTNADFTQWINAFHGRAEKYNCVDYFPNSHLKFMHITFKNSFAYKNNEQLANEKILQKVLPIALVIMQDNNLYGTSMITSASHTYRVHHSSIPAGQAVYFAAEAFAKDGIFSRITDKSGHYKPNLEAFVYGLGRMKELGANFTSTMIMVNAWDESNERVYLSGTNFLELYKNNGFDSQDFAGTVNTLEDATNAFTTQNAKKGKSKIYFVAETNELYKATLVNKQPIFTTFYDLYQAQQAARHALPAYNASRDLVSNISSTAKPLSVPATPHLSDITNTSTSSSSSRKRLKFDD